MAERAIASGAKAPSKTIQRNIAKSTEALFTALWRPLHDEADAHAARAKSGLASRARKEADDLKKLLERRRTDLRASILDLRQGDLLSDTSDAAATKEQQRQLRLDLDAMTRREADMLDEIETEPEAVAALYEVRMMRLSPVGLVVSYPESMT